MTVHNRNENISIGSSVSCKQLLCFVHGQGQKREQEHSTNNSFFEFHYHWYVGSITTPCSREEPVDRARVSSENRA